MEIPLLSSSWRRYWSGPQRLWFICYQNWMSQSKKGQMNQNEWHQGTKPYICRVFREPFLAICRNKGAESLGRAGRKSENIFFVLFLLSQVWCNVRRNARLLVKQIKLLANGKVSNRKFPHKVCTDVLMWVTCLWDQKNKHPNYPVTYISNNYAKKAYRATVPLNLCYEARLFVLSTIFFRLFLFTPSGGLRPSKPNLIMVLWFWALTPDCLTNSDGFTLLITIQYQSGQLPMWMMNHPRDWGSVSVSALFVGHKNVSKPGYFWFHYKQTLTESASKHSVLFVQCNV
jgi:hypothetical protein